MFYVIVSVKQSGFLTLEVRWFMSVSSFWVSASHLEVLVQTEACELWHSQGAMLLYTLTGCCYDSYAAWIFNHFLAHCSPWYTLQLVELGCEPIYHHISNPIPSQHGRNQVQEGQSALCRTLSADPPVFQKETFRPECSQISAFYKHMAGVLTQSPATQQ